MGWASVPTKSFPGLSENELLQFENIFFPSYGEKGPIVTQWHNGAAHCRWIRRRATLDVCSVLWAVSSGPGSGFSTVWRDLGPVAFCSLLGGSSHWASHSCPGLEVKPWLYTCLMSHGCHLTAAVTAPTLASTLVAGDH